MRFFKLFVQGLYFALIYESLLFVGESLFPGSLEPTAFSFLGVLIIFLLLTFDWVFSVGSAEA